MVEFKFCTSIAFAMHYWVKDLGFWRGSLPTFILVGLILNPYFVALT